MTSPSNLKPHRLRYYIGVRDGKRVTVFVDGQIDGTGVERMSAETARRLDALLDGGPYHDLDHIEEPIVGNEAPPVAIASTRAHERLVTAGNTAPIA